MKKKLRQSATILLAVIMLFSALPFTSSAYTEDENGVMHFTEEETLEMLTYQITDGEVTITACDGYSPYDEYEFEVPLNIEGYPVTAVAEKAFLNCRGMIKCTLPYTVKTIGDKAFEGAYELKELVANGVVEIGSRAFWGSSLEDVTLPETLEKLAADTFIHCNTIKRFTISSNNEYFSSESGVLFNKDMTELIAFPALRAVETYTVPETVTVIGDNAFANCKNNTALKTVVLTDVVTIGTDAFLECPATSITLNDGVETIGEAAFYQSGIETMVLPASVKTIGKEAFRNCDNLKSINIPEGVTRLEGYMFYLTDLEELYLPSTLTYLGHESAPWSLTKVYYNGTKADWQELQEYEYDSGFFDVEVFFNDGTSHKHDLAWRTVKPSTCIELGSEDYGCPECNIIFETRDIKLSSHFEGDVVITKKPTTSSDGEKAVLCEVCNEVLETWVLSKLESCIGYVKYTQSEDTHNKYSVRVFGRATMVQFIEPDGGTRTYDRNSEKVTIYSYDYNWNPVNSMSRDLYFEVWSINTNLSADVNIEVRAKYVEGNGYKWDNAKYSFEVNLIAPDKDVRTILRLDGSSATSGPMGPVEVKVTVGPKADGLRFVMPDGSKTTYLNTTATVLENGDLQFIGKFWANNMGENVIKVQTKLAGGKWETVKEFTYNANEYPY